MNTLDSVLPFIIGYLIGSVSPGYILGRLVKGIDVRKYGNHNTGATNTFKIVGPAYGLIAGAFDFFKAPLAYYISIRFLEVDPSLAIVVGLWAVLGHIFPFYLGFRGGRGMASLYGLAVIATVHERSIYSLALSLGTVSYAVIYAGFVSRTLKIEAPLRKLLKLAGLFFPLGLFWLSTETLLWISGILLLISGGFDLLRFSIPRINKKYLEKKFFAKRKEAGFFSGYTLFLTSIFVVILLFSREIAAVSLTFFILGDILAPFSKATVFLPQKKIIGDKTWGGAILIIIAAVFSGIFLQALVLPALSLKTIFAGAVAVAVLDQLSFIIDDNILVPIGTAFLLMLLV
jgi:glycerol-3-phosphate acyltransferase PlsY